MIVLIYFYRKIMPVLSFVEKQKLPSGKLPIFPDSSHFPSAALPVSKKTG
jgi:hypothetical protein